MACIKVYGRNLSKEELEEIRALAILAGCAVEDISVIEKVGEPDPACDDEIILVLANGEICASPQLETEFAKAQNGARRVICVWPDGSEAAELPAAAAKYCYSILPWDAGKLRQVCADDDVTILETSTGEPLPKVDTDRNLCVESEEKPK